MIVVVTADGGMIGAIYQENKILEVYLANLCLSGRLAGGMRPSAWGRGDVKGDGRRADSACS